MDTKAAIAFARFGLGRRRDEPVPPDPRAWLRTQLMAPDAAPSDGLLSTTDILTQLWTLKQQDKADAVERARTGTKGATPSFLELTRSHEATALLANALVTPAGFRERLVWFWANHFTVAARNEFSGVCLGAYIREAIRPNVTGRFSDMLLAVMRHPAMLGYLDQFRSVGPNSLAGQRHNEGLNENLARECLELHTVSPASGYTQADVTNFAKVLTGWSFQTDRDPRGFLFRPNAHEPGTKIVMGGTWPEGEEGGVQLLEWLAKHPYTYRHLATKLARHFVADEPPPDAITQIETALRNTDGDLGTTSAVLIDLQGAWTPLTKLRTPQEYVIACLRAVGAHPDAEPKLQNMIGALGQPVFRPPFPIGWPDRAADWSNPAAILQRVDFAYQFAGRVTDQEPAQVAQDALGPLLRPETLNEIRHAGSRQDGLALALASPEFQRR
jgi:uncharacterized protein (DUF1800 family)